jgi:uncharacterized protein YceK
MKKIVLLLMALSVSGCASVSDIENLQGQLDNLGPKVAKASADAYSAKQEAGKAVLAANRAEVAALSAEASAKATNEKLDRMFQRGQYK